MKIRGIHKIAVPAIAVALLFGIAALANAQTISRSLLATRLSNEGRDGGTALNNAQTRLAYPRHWNNSGDTGRAKAGPSSRGYFDNSTGHGFFIMTQMGGEAQTTWTGPRNMTGSFGEINGMQYNPVTDGPEAHLGTEVFEVRGSTYRIGNWWQGHEPVDPNNPVGLTIENHRFYEYITDDTFPEQIAINKWTTSQGITFVRKAYAWSYPNFDDFIIQRVEFTNTGDSDGDGERDLPEEILSPVYIALANFFGASGGEAHNYNESWWRHGPRVNDDWLAYSDAPNYPVDLYSQTGKTVPPGLKLTYAYDGDHPDVPFDDAGGPLLFNFLSTQKKAARIAIEDGQFGAFQFIGMAPIAYANSGPFAFGPLDAGKSYVDPEGDQPAAVRWYRSHSTTIQDDPNPAIHNPQEMQEMLLHEISNNPTEVGYFFNAQTYGPYTLAPGESGMIVFAYVAGAGSQMVGEDMLTWALKHKKEELPLGLDAMLQNLEAAKFAYRAEFDIPDAPPDVAFHTRITPDAHMEVFWSDKTDNATNPDYSGAEAQDVIGYEIWRAEWIPVGPWTKIADIAAGSAVGGEYSYEDKDSVAGFLYRYAVRAVAKGHTAWTNGMQTLSDLPAHIQQNVQAGLKGGRRAPFQQEHGDTSPELPSAAHLDALEEKVRVVPNPYILDPNGPHRYPGAIEKFRFVGIPSKCEIYIFTTTGDLVIKLDHDNPNIGEKSWDHKVQNLITLAGSGVYYYVVKSLVPGHEGKIQRGTFFVIR
jgi:hypothetical protein